MSTRLSGEYGLESFCSEEALLEQYEAAERLHPVQLTGDFYRESDDVTRGVTLLSGEEMYFPHELSCKCLTESAAPSMRFSDSVLPPAVPLAESQMLPTSLRLTTDSAADVAESICQFLETEVASIIIKVSPQKFSVKADVFQDLNGCPAHCLLKARVWRCGTTLLVEFCRRRGDSVAFQGLFRAAVQFLLTKFESPAMPEMTNFALPPPAPETLAKLELLPLLDMIQGGAAQGPLQAEALAALAALANLSQAGADAVCAALQELRPSLRAAGASPSSEVAFPACCLLSTLGEVPVIADLQRVVQHYERQSSCAVAAKRAAAALGSPAMGHAGWTDFAGFA